MSWIILCNDEFLIFLSHQSKDHQEHSDSERGADRRAVEEQVGEREGEEQDAEKHCHLAGERAQPLEGWWGPQPRIQHLTSLSVILIPTEICEIFEE